MSNTMNQANSEWKEYRLADFVDINPTEILPKGTIAKKIAMEVVQPFTKKISSYSHKEYKGGVRFKNGDTIMARITPSLENGKTSYVDILDDGEIGFGSTEFIVLRGKENVSDKHFVYYLVISPSIKNIAIKSMTGSSGRQRVQTNVVKNQTVFLPPLPEQKAIAEVLSCLDDKIDLLHRQNKTLEQLAETLFRKWFVEPFDPAQGVGAKEEWEERPLSELFDFKEGPGIRNWQYVKSGVPFINIKLIKNGEIDKTTANFVSFEEGGGKYRHFHLQLKDMVISASGTLGKNAIIRKYHLPLLLNTSVIRFRPKDGIPYSFMYQYLQSNKFYEHLITAASGSVQLNFGPTHLNQINIKTPPVELLKNFQERTEPIYEKFENNYNQIFTLKKLRDTLLPKLMNGTVRVKFK